MKKYSFLLLVGFLFMLIGCSQKVEIYGDLEESKIIVNEEQEIITFHTLIKNDGKNDTEPLYAKFIINDEQLANALELESEEILFSDDQNNPELFTVSKKNGFIVSLSYYYKGNIPLEQLKGAVTVVIFDENDNEVTRFTIEHVIDENA